MSAQLDYDPTARFIIVQSVYRVHHIEACVGLAASSHCQVSLVYLDVLDVSQGIGRVLRFLLGQPRMHR